MDHYIDEPGYYVPVHRITGTVSNNYTIKKAITKEKHHVNKDAPLRKNKNGEYIDMSKRKYERKLELVGEIEEDSPSDGDEIKIFKENTINRKRIKFFKEMLDGSNRAFLIVLEIWRGGVFQSSFKFSHKQIWGLKDIVCSAFLNLVEWNDNDMVLCNEVKTYIALLKEPEYMICSKHLVEMGATTQSANVILKSLVKKGNLVPCGKVGKFIFYTCKIPRHKLAEMFKPYKED